jgi:hypothetical protein
VTTLLLVQVDCHRCFWKQIVGTLNFILWSHYSEFWDFAEHFKRPRQTCDGWRRKSSGFNRPILIDERMPLPNPIQLIRHPTGANSNDRHQHKQRSQREAGRSFITESPSDGGNVSDSVAKVIFLIMFLQSSQP